MHLFPHGEINSLIDHFEDTLQPSRRMLKLLSFTVHLRNSKSQKLLSMIAVKVCL